MTVEQRSSSDAWMGRHTIFDRQGKGTALMTRYWIGRLRLHIFYRGDADQDCHDHPWDFWTFPLTPYVEEVVTRTTPWPATVVDTPEGLRFVPIEYDKTFKVVPAFRLSFRPATYVHRVMGRYAGNAWDDFQEEIVEKVPAKTVNATYRYTPYWYPPLEGKRIITIVWRSRSKRTWGFLKNRDGRWCWQIWKDYIRDGGNSTPCE